jgi:phosphoribosylglycinamide formyltransferase-1
MIRILGAVLRNGYRLTGATVHFINNEANGRAIIDRGLMRIPAGISEQELREEIIKVKEMIIAETVKDISEVKTFVENGIAKVS